MNILNASLGFARANQQTHLNGLCDWLRIPSISTLQEHATNVREAGEYAAGYLRKMGMSQVEVRETEGHPLVYAQWMNARERPTILVYGHFDVQPVDPVREWMRPPFEPTIEGEKLFARGASDDKGQAYAVLAALESYLSTSGRLPVNVKVLLEGEEEITSPNLPGYLHSHSDELKADAILIADQDMLDLQHPVVLWGVRGILYSEIEIFGPGRDLHSGTFGGSVDNPLNVLTRLLAALQDGSTRRVSIPGFYDRVQELNAEERELISMAPIDEQLGLQLTGSPSLAGEKGYPLVERISVRPTLEIHGIAGGFTAEGSKTLIPSRVTAKVSMRLVPDQDPDEVEDSFHTYLKGLCPPTVRLSVRTLGKAAPVKIDYKSPAVQAAAKAYEKGFGHPPVFLRGGGSLPIVRDLIDLLSPAGGEIPVVMIGFGLPDDRTHSPNEQFHIPNFHLGIETVIHYLDLFGDKQTTA